MDRTVQRSDEHHTAQAYALGAGGRVRHGLYRGQMGHRAERLLQGPGTLEPERLGPCHVGPEASGIELTVGDELRDRNCEAHRLPPLIASCYPTGIHPEGPQCLEYEKCRAAGEGASDEPPIHTQLLLLLVEP